MNDLISRKTAIDAVYKCTDYYVGNLPVMIDKADAYKALADLPAADAVPVIRCKDCKYMTEHYDTDGNVPYWTCSEWDSGTDYDGFCHYAERRADE